MLIMHMQSAHVQMAKLHNMLLPTHLHTLTTPTLLMPTVPSKIQCLVDAKD